MASKLGYTWYPKDWGNSESVFELSLSERGMYRELIDLAMLNDNKTEIKKTVWCRKFGVQIVELDCILTNLESLNLIEIKEDILFVPSCEKRLNLVRGGSKGGKKNKPTLKPIAKPFQSLEEKNGKPIVKQIEREREREKKEGETHTIHSFEHLSINNIEFDKLEKMYSNQDIFDCFDKIQNYKENKKYKSLYLTAKIWLKKDYQTKKENADLPDDLNINFKMLLEWFNEMIEPDIILTQVPEPTKKRYLNLLQSGFTKLHIETAIVNARRDRESLTNCTIDTFSYLPMLNKYQKDVSRIGAL